MRYQDRPNPTHCEHDVLWIIGITRDEVSAEDQARLEELGFFWDDGARGWQSFRYGSA